MEEKILKQILEELKKLNKHLDNIEAKEIGEMIYNTLGARTLMPERFITCEELKALVK